MMRRATLIARRPARHVDGCCPGSVIYKRKRIERRARATLRCLVLACTLRPEELAWLLHTVTLMCIIHNNLLALCYYSSSKSTLPYAAVVSSTCDNCVRVYPMYNGRP